MPRMNTLAPALAALIVTSAPISLSAQTRGADEGAIRQVIEAAYVRVDITGTAVVKLQLFINGEHEYTDYFGLYRFSDGWRIVTKVFQSHD